jgi:hypothetical protein
MIIFGATLDELTTETFRSQLLEAIGGRSFIQPVLGIRRALPTRSLPNHAAGSRGPKEADGLLERDGWHWMNSLLGRKMRPGRSPEAGVIPAGETLPVRHWLRGSAANSGL